MQQLEIDFSAATTSFGQSCRVVACEQPVQQTTPDNPVAKLWQQIAEKKRALRQSRRQLDELMQWLELEIADDRAAVAQAMIELTERLLQHLGKKSLAQWQRLEVAIWVLDNIESLDGFRCDTQDFKKRYQVLYEQFYQPEPAAEFPEDSDWLSRMFTDLNAKAVVDDALNVDHLAEMSAESSTDEARQRRTGVEHNLGSGAGNSDTVSADFVTKLFRRTARVLHPDLADTDDARLRNGSLMKTLLKARREQDVATLVELYLEHVGNPDLDPGAADLQHLQSLLQRQLQRLQRELSAIAEQSPLHGWVVENLLHHSEREQQRALGRMRAELYEMARQARAISRRVRTLASLKPVLAERHDARHFA